MANSLKNRILNYIRKSDGWINGGELEKLAESVNACCRLSELVILLSNGFLQNKKMFALRL